MNNKLEMLFQNPNFSIPLAVTSTSTSAISVLQFGTTVFGFVGAVLGCVLTAMLIVINWSALKKQIKKWYNNLT